MPLGAKARERAEKSQHGAGEGGRLSDTGPAPAQLPGTRDLWGVGFPVMSPNNFIT